MNKALRETAFLCIVSLLAMGGTWLVHPDLPPWDPMTLEEGEISIEEAQALENLTWIDARTEPEFESGHITNAILLNEDNWDTLFEAFIQTWDGESTLVVYCDSRICANSKQVASRLKEALGTDKVFVLKGGWQTWLTQKK